MNQQENNTLSLDMLAGKQRKQLEELLTIGHACDDAIVAQDTERLLTLLDERRVVVELVEDTSRYLAGKGTTAEGTLARELLELDSLLERIMAEDTARFERLQNERDRIDKQRETALRSRSAITAYAGGPLHIEPRLQDGQA